MNKRGFYKQKAIERVERMNDKEKGEFLYRAVVILDILPACECQRIADLLTQMYFS